jgi:hypothetical protein
MSLEPARGRRPELNQTELASELSNEPDAANSAKLPGSLFFELGYAEKPVDAGTATPEDSELLETPTAKVAAGFNRLMGPTIREARKQVANDLEPTIREARKQLETELRQAAKELEPTIREVRRHLQPEIRRLNHEVSKMVRRAIRPQHGRSRERRPGPCRARGSRRGASTRSSSRGGDSGDDPEPAGGRQLELTHGRSWRLSDRRAIKRWIAERLEELDRAAWRGL